uniref:SKP1-like protein 4 n=1 Tax=Anthurium amnicola TaxID=1678845 RepID=A0A1D1ZB08_9ARAE
MPSDGEVSSSKQLPDMVNAEAGNLKRLPDEIDAEANSSKQLTDKVDVESKSLNQLPHKSETDAGSSNQLPDKIDTETGSSKHQPDVVLLRCMGGEEFEVEVDMAMQSGAIKHMIEDLGPGSCIPVPNVSADVLAKILEFFKHHREDHLRKPKDSKGFLGQFEPDLHEEELKKFDIEFVNVGRDPLFELLMAADYLNAKKLLDVTCQAIADNIKDMSVEDVREYFQIENDYTPEEEQKLRKEYKWAFE